MRMFINIASGIQYLHRNKIMHRDLKPENIFLTSAGECVIGDVGFGKVDFDSFLNTTYAGTPLYMAPEILKEESYNEKCDIFSLAATMYTLCSLTPYNEECKSIPDLLYLNEKIILKSLPTHFDEGILQLLTKMVLPPNKRLGIDEVVNSDLFAKYKEDCKVIIKLIAHVRSYFDMFCLPLSNICKPSPRQPIAVRSPVQLSPEVKYTENKI